MRSAPLRAALLGALGLFAAGPAQRSVPRPVQPASEERPAAESLDCLELWAHPGRYLGQELTLQVQFDAWIERWNPFITRFGPVEYRAFAAWGEEQFPWRAEDYEAPRARLFVRRGSAADWALDTARRHQALQLQVAVRAVFDDVPWVEVLGVRPLLRGVPEGSLLHAQRALELMQRKAWQRADQELTRALAAPLSDRAREELERLRAVCRAEIEALEARPLLRRQR